MEFLKSFTIFNSLNPYEDPFLFEGKGIPNILKNIYDGIYDDISKDFSKIQKYTIDEIDLKIRVLSVECHNIDTTGTCVGNSVTGLIEQKFLISPKIDLSFNFNENNEEEIKRVILHELLHIYEIYQRIINDSKKQLQWQTNILQNLREKYKNDDFLSDLILIIYLTSDQEIGARITETYNILINERTDNINKLINILNSSASTQRIKEIKKFITSIKEYKIDYNRCTEFFKEFNSLVKTDKTFNIFSIPENNKDVDKIIKNYLILFDKKIKYFRQKLLKLIDEVVIDVKNLKSSTIEGSKLKRIL